MTKITRILSVLPLAATAVGIGFIWAEREPSNTVSPEIANFDKPLDSCFTQSDINWYFAHRSIVFSDSVKREFETYASDKMPKSAKKEWKLWVRYSAAAIEAYRSINMGGFCGSAAPMGFHEFALSLNEQMLASFAYEGTTHAAVTDQAIDDEYDRFLDFGLPLFSGDDTEYTMADKRSNLLAERDAWHRWIHHRSKVAKQLQGDARATYDLRTNQLKRMKLIQLKNQYQDYSLCSDDIWDMMLSPDCSDDELARYSSLDALFEK